MGSVALGSLNLLTNSVASSTMVISAENVVSKIKSKPNNFNAVTIFPVDITPTSTPKASAIFILTAGAIWQTTIFPFLFFKTFVTSSLL